MPEAALPIPELRRSLLRWYAGAARDLPWRRTSDPWAILVSELMLQQTQVKTVLPYYGRFLKQFPAPQALAKAPEQAVLAAWAGLGYYRRARFLQAAAKAVVAAGGFPKDIDGLRALPGVGAYTAAAVGSIAFGLQAAVVDGNVVRVLSRLLALEADPSRGAGAARIRETAETLLDPRHPGDFNQAVMELGASLCAPTKPDCPACPWKTRCAAFLSGRQAEFPRLPARPEAKRLHKAAALLVQGRGSRTQVLARPRSAAGKPKPGQAPDRLRGFWAFPEVEIEREDWDLARGLASKEARRLGGKGAKEGGRLPKLRHAITVYDIHVLAHWFTAEGAPAPKGGWEWVGLNRLEKLPLAAAEKKLLGMLKRALGRGEEEGPQLGLKL